MARAATAGPLRALGLVVVAAASLLGPSPALADAPALASSPTPAGAPAPFEPHHFVLGHALSVVIRRIGVGYELLPTTHHSFGLNVHGQWPGTKYLSVAPGEVAGFGAELGYRYYAGDHGPNGPFFGVSVLTGYYYSRTTFLDSDPNALWYAQYGWAIDLGWATYLNRDIVVALAIGAQRTWIDVDRSAITDQAQLLNGEGVRPRAQIQIGRAF